MEVFGVDEAFSCIVNSPYSQVKFRSEDKRIDFRDEETDILNFLGFLEIDVVRLEVGRMFLSVEKTVDRTSWFTRCRWFWLLLYVVRIDHSVVVFAEVIGL